MKRGIEITGETFDVIAQKLQEELTDIIKSKKEVNDYELIVYKYIFISELKIPLLEDLGVEITDDAFILYVIPDDLQFSCLRQLDDVFDKFEMSFMANEFNILKIKFLFNGD
ncbi:MAG: hypothetical protein UIB31_03210 [Methanobrevibacter sp.]|nr:hypothetical protein [Methanobrevibacter sp.]MBE6490910.1 hypothetical protein [Methanobrevibacter sp.]MEE0901516.1 hypothetical protein [Methanobrevibacter sp.]